MSNSWVYQSKMSDVYISKMNEIDRQEFNFSVHGLDHDEVLAKYSYGIRRYFL